MPQRISGLWPRLITFENLLLAHRKARRGKRERLDVAAFEFDLETNLLALQRERLRLELNPKHRQIVDVKRGLSFLGLRVFPEHRRVTTPGLARSVRRLKTRINIEGLRLNNGRFGAAQPWLAHVSHADTWHLRMTVLTRLVNR